MSFPPHDASASEKTDAPLPDGALVAAFLEHAPEHVYFKDRASRFIAASKSMARTFRVDSVSGLLGKTDFDFFDEAHARPAFDDEQKIINTGEPILDKVEKESWPDGRVTWVVTSKMPLRNDEGRIIGTFGVSKDITEAKKIESEIERTRKELLETTRRAGMAEVATGVLHNVGNVLNSLNVSATVLGNGLRQSKVDSLVKVGELLREHQTDLGAYLTQDPKGRLVPGFIESMARHFAEDRARLLKEIESLQKNVDHIKEIVSMQQAYARMVGVVEALEPEALMEDSIRMNSGALLRHDVSVVRRYQPVPLVIGEKGKVLQILVNFIRNAKYACDEGGQPEKTVTLRIEPGTPGTVRLTVQDNGVGIPPEHLPLVFQHGFTTKATGHGFGLHSSANAAREMKGRLSVDSAGIGTGASFTLEMPVAPAGSRPPAP